MNQIWSLERRYYEDGGVVAVSADVEKLKALAEAREHGRRVKPRTYKWFKEADGWTLQSTRSNDDGAWYVRPVDIVE